jgi:hypothetical protein
MAGLLDDMPQDQAPGLLSGFGAGGLSQMLLATGAGLLGGQGWHGAMQAGLQAQQAARRDAIQTMLLRNKLMNERAFRFRSAGGRYGLQPASYSTWGTDLGGGGS